MISIAIREVTGISKHTIDSTCKRLRYPKQAGILNACPVFDIVQPQSMEVHTFRRSAPRRSWKKSSKNGNLTDRVISAGISRLPLVSLTNETTQTSPQEGSYGR